MLELILRNCTVIDGTGAPRFEADIAVEGETIADIGVLGAASAKETIDAAQLGTRANFYEPRVHPDGIRHVFVNGRAVVRDGMFRKGVLAGKMIRRK
jgi:N-acyl-D-aspartate/D-glutamate deacylase